MEPTSIRLLEIGNYYVREDDELTAAVVRANPDATPIDLLWKIREEAKKTFGDDVVDDVHPDEPIRKSVGVRRAIKKLIHFDL